MTVFPAIDCGKCNPKLNCEPLLGQFQRAPEFPNQLPKGRLFNTHIVLVERHISLYKVL